VARWRQGARAVQFLISRGRLESFAAADLAALADAQIARAAVSAQFAADIPAFAKPTFERLRRTRHTAQYFDPSAAPLTKADASWAISKATAAVSGARALLAKSPPERFS